MKMYVLQRLLTALPVLGLIAVITFTILHLAPGDPAAVLLGDLATAEDIAQLREDMGLERPLYVQFGVWLSNIIQGDFGRSIFSEQPVLQAFAERLEPTLSLAIISEILAIVIALPLGILAAWRPNTWIDRFAMIFAVMGFSIPSFWLGINLIYLFSLKIHLLPVLGYVPLKEGLVPFLRHLTLPILTVGFISAALIARISRASMLEVLREDYIRTARAKGLREKVVLFRHAFKNASIPVVTMIGLSFGHLVAGLVVVETVFAIPGAGRFIVEAVLHRDYPVIQGALLLVGLSYVIINLVVILLLKMPMKKQRKQVRKLLKKCERKRPR